MRIHRAISWLARSEQEAEDSGAAVMQGDTAVLSVVFDWLSVLRNQLIHGGASWNSQANRGQLRDGVAILAVLVPLVVAVMPEHPEVEFEEVLYPVV